MARHDTVGIIVPIRIFIIFVFGFLVVFLCHRSRHRNIVNPDHFRHWWFSCERSNHTTATELCPDMGRCCSWHTSGGVVLHPHQAAGGDVRSANQGHGGLPCWPSNHSTAAAPVKVCYEIQKKDLGTTPGLAHHTTLSPTMLEYKPHYSVTFRANTFPLSQKLCHIIVYCDFQFRRFFLKCTHESIINIQIVIIMRAKQIKRGFVHRCL